MANGISDKNIKKHLNYDETLDQKSERSKQPSSSEECIPRRGWSACTGVCRLFTRGLRKGAAAIVRREHPGMLPQSQAL